MTSKIRFIIILLSFQYTQVLSQTKFLKTGHSVSELKVSGVLNYKSDSLYFNDFKSQFIILDFWNTACISCIKSFPKIDSLQKQYSGKIQFILANPESKDSTIHFFKKHSGIKMPDVPIITGAKNISRMFSVNTYPFTVWINDYGVIKHFIAAYNISKQNLDDFITDKKILTKQLDKTIYRGSYFDTGRPDSLQSNIQYYCYIAKYSDAIDIGNAEQGIINDSVLRMSYFRESIVSLYKKAYREYNLFNFNHPGSVVLLVKDSTKYLAPKQPSLADDWLLQNGYSFDMQLPISNRNNVYKIMQQQLYIFFGLEVRVYRELKNGKLIDFLEIKE